MTSPHRNSLTDRGGRVDCAATLMARSAWPEIMQRLRRRGLGVLEFRRRQARCKRGEHRAGGIFDIDAGVAMDAIMNALKEGAAALRCQMGIRMPAFIVQPAQQYRQLRADIYGLVSRKNVAQRMHGCQQDQIDTLAVMPAETAHDVIDPGFCLGYSD